MYYIYSLVKIFKKTIFVFHFERQQMNFPCSTLFGGRVSVFDQIISFSKLYKIIISS